jgi:hypothetical protein
VVLALLPESATRTPMRVVVAGSVTLNGAALLSQISRPLLAPTSASGRVASTLPSLSFTSWTAPATGRTSGTATGSAPASVPSWRISTRACALMAGTLARRKSQGRSASVILTSMCFCWQGAPPSLKSVPPLSQ